MKISEGMVQMASDHTGREWGAAVRGIEIRQVRSGAGVLSGQVWTGQDRVSLNSGMAYQSGYAASLGTESRVSRTENGDTDAFSDTSMIQRLAGGVLGRQVTVSDIRQEEGIRVSGAGLRLGAFSGVQAQAVIRETRIHYEDEAMGFAARGQVTTEDGRAIDFSMDLAVRRSLLTQTEQTALVNAWQGAAALTDPLVISLDGGVPSLSDTRFSFDLDSDGTMEEISFVSGGSGFLAFDKNMDGKVNDGSELFGPASGNGFDDLALHDQDQNGWIDENDAVFSQLSVWTKDASGDDRLVSLKEAGIGAIFLGHADTPFALKGEDGTLNGQMAASGMVLFENGKVGLAQQIDLAVTETVPAPDPAPDVTVSQPLFPLFPAAEPSARTRPVDPFQALTDEIESLREKLRRLLEGRSDPMTERWAWSGFPVQGQHPGAGKFFDTKG